jgi:hypothetical protein
MWELKKTDFSFHGSGDNKYIALWDHSTKNHRGDSKDDNESQGGRLYVIDRPDQYNVFFRILSEFVFFVLDIQ